MCASAKLRLFISYSHRDEGHFNEFKKHLAPLKEKGLISEWHDQKIMAGEDFQKSIDDHLEKADIVCLLISPDFLDSTTCKKETTKAIELKEKKGVSLIPIILSECGWKDVRNISSLLALPKDGKPVSSFERPNIAWNNVYEELKRVIQKENDIRRLEFSDPTISFLQDTELLTKAHSKKETVLLSDIFIYPELTKYDSSREYERKDSSEKVIDDFSKYSKIILAGENQSGKTTLCKKFIIKLREKNFVPIYLSNGNQDYKVQIRQKIARAYEKQYKSSMLLEKIDKDRIVLVLDDFYLARNKEERLRALSSYCNQIVVVDDIFGLNFRNNALIKSFMHFKIEELLPSLRNELIKNWVGLTDDNHVFKKQNTTYEEIDRTTELVDSALGKIIGSGIMPAYPFFILTIITAYETSAPLDREITSQGYCYQALIYLYLRKQGVKNDEIDTYMNFLTELGIYFYEERKQELFPDDFGVFMKKYADKYNLPINRNKLMSNLQNANIFLLNDLGNYTFSYPYLYFFFVAKYLAEHLDKKENVIISIMNNLHKNDNAYIAVFIAHHSKSIWILDEILKIAKKLFCKHQPATLNRSELQFFDKQKDIIVQATFDQRNNSPEYERDKALKEQDRLEQTNKKEKLEEDSELLKELRRSVKTVEVMGMIIKNRAGSLEKDKLVSVFKEGMKVHKRSLQSFMEIIKNKENQQSITNFISSKLDSIIRDQRAKLDQSDQKRISEIIFWNLNFFVVYATINKIVHSLGSDKLIEIAKIVYDEENTPAAFLVKHGIFMWYGKNLQIDNIAKGIKSGDFSLIAQNIVKHEIVNHCRVHSVTFRKKQKIQFKLNIPRHKLLMRHPSRDQPRS